MSVEQNKIPIFPIQYGKGKGGAGSKIKPEFVAGNSVELKMMMMMYYALRYLIRAGLWARENILPISAPLTGCHII
jgi:hypothetical protein